MSSEAFATHLARAFFSMFHHGGANFMSSDRLRSNYFLDRAKNIILNGDHAVSRHTTNSPPVIPGEAHISVNLDSQSGNNGQGTNTCEESGGQAAVRQHGSVGAMSTRSTQRRALMAGFIVGGLSLIIVPGLILGIMTRQPPWGIALSGAIATVVSFFAGLYYHLNK